MQTKGGDNMKEDMKEGYDYISECIDKLDNLIENPKSATPEALMEIRDKLASEGEMIKEDEMDNEEGMEEKGKPTIMIAIGKAMKKGMKLLILSLLATSILSGVCSAERKFTRKDWDKASSKELYLYYSTETISALTVNQVNFTTNIVCASTYPVILKSIVIEKAGIESVLDIYNSRISTFATGVERVISLKTSTSSASTNFNPVVIPYDIYLDSGMAINNIGQSSPKITIVYKEK